MQRATGADGSSPCVGIAPNDDCFWQRVCSDGSGICNTTADCNQCVESGQPCTIDDDCRECVDTGTPCQTDADCAGGQCIASGESCFISGATCEQPPGGPRLLNTCSGACTQIIRACESDNDCNYCNVNHEIHCDNDDDCPSQQTCIENALCNVDNPRTNCETTSDCDEVGEECFARSGILGTIMPVDTGSTTPGETFCCHPSGPDQPAFGSVWAKFIATSTSAELSTCTSNGAQATDSIIEVYRIELDKACSDTGASCVQDEDCANGLCEPSNQVACGTRVPIACNDNILVGCADPNNSKVCVTDLEIGATYLVQIAAVTQDALDKYSLRLRSPCPGNIPTPPSNDTCSSAQPIDEGSWPFTLVDATMDCPFSVCTPPNGPFGPPYIMLNDVWFEYVAPADGLVTVDTCAESAPQTPATTMYVFEGTTCPVATHSEITCNNDAMGDCGFGSRVSFNVVAQETYRVRVGGEFGGEPSGMLNVHFAEDCQLNRRDDLLDLACGFGNVCRTCSDGSAICDVDADCPAGEACTGIPTTGSGDCDENGIPDECDVGGDAGLDCNGNSIPDFCDVGNGTSPDCNGNVVPDECETDGDGDGIIDACDGCPEDPEKIAPGICGCGIADADSDSDTVPDCVDQCPGEDDFVDENDNGVPDCLEVGTVPTVSGWGLLVLALLLLVSAKLRLYRRVFWSRN